MKPLLILLLAAGFVLVGTPAATAHDGSVVCVDDPVCYSLCTVSAAGDIVKRHPVHRCEYRQS